MRSIDELKPQGVQRRGEATPGWKATSWMGQCSWRLIIYGADTESSAHCTKNVISSSCGGDLILAS